MKVTDGTRLAGSICRCPRHTAQRSAVALLPTYR